MILELVSRNKRTNKAMSSLFLGESHLGRGVGEEGGGAVKGGGAVRGRGEAGSSIGRGVRGN